MGISGEGGTPQTMSKYFSVTYLGKGLAHVPCVETYEFLRVFTENEI